MRHPHQSRLQRIATSIRNSLVAAAIVVMQLVPGPANASNVCVDYLNMHIGDPQWRAKCLEWMDAQTSPPPPFAAATSPAGSGSASALAGLNLAPPVHASATNLAVASGAQNEVFIAADPSPAGAGRVFLISKTEPFANGLFAAYSTDHGGTWNPSNIAVGPGGTIPAGVGDPWAVFSDTGKLFISYLKADIDEGTTFGVPLPSNTRPTIIAQSDDGGATFTFVEALRPAGNTDEGTMAIGPGGAVSPEALWIIYKDVSASPRTIVVAGARIDAQGDPVIGSCGKIFCEQIIAYDDAGVGRPGTTFPGHVAVGPSGQVVASYLR